MRAIKAFITRHPVSAYFALTFSISWGGVLLVIGGPRGIPGTAEQFAKLLPLAIPAMLAGPSVAGLLLTGLVSGRAGFREVLSRLFGRRVGIRWYAVALLIAPIAFTAALLTLALTSPRFLPGIFTTSDKAFFLLSNIAGAVVVGFFEELGWTGFAIPRIRLRDSVLTTGLIVGVVWGAWHVLTNDLWASGASLGSGELSLPLFVTLRGLGLLVTSLPAFRVLMVWVYDRTGSLLVAMLMHASYAACTFILGPPVSGAALLTYDLALGAAMWVVVAAVAVATGGQFSQRPLHRLAA